ncbi:GATA-binding factor 5-B [Thelohanellus kitauei]|uniref:GATA-binding factor 5-B n=1 Tax=Thelohanellus kitauei TaxID=669202 RepID=A0A0C2MQT6_THEKT|nr:GATA-binding factor 5-B [Thelohanellus kitauei]
MDLIHPTIFHLIHTTHIANSIIPASLLNVYQEITSANSVLPIQAFPNNQGGSIWPISYINPNTYHNNVQYPVENVPFPQNAQLENLASMRQVNPIYINEGHPNDSSARQQHYGMGEKQGLFCSVCKKADDDPTYRRDLKMYVCRYCGGGFCNNYGENRNTIQSRKHASSHKIDACCSNCKTNTTSLWRRSSNGEPICNACGLYFKLHGTNRPLSMKKDEIQTRTRRSNRTDRFRMSKVVTRSGTQAQYLPGRGQPDNHSYQGNNYSDHQAQANHAI